MNLTIYQRIFNLSIYLSAYYIIIMNLTLYWHITYLSMHLSTYYLPKLPASICISELCQEGQAYIKLPLYCVVLYYITVYQNNYNEFNHLCLSANRQFIYLFIGIISAYPIIYQHVIVFIYRHFITLDINFIGISSICIFVRISSIILYTIDYIINLSICRQQ